MTELQEQLYSLLAGVAAITGGVYYGEFAETAEDSSTTYPYSVFEFLSSPEEELDTNTYRRIAKVQVDVWSISNPGTIADSINTSVKNKNNYTLTDFAIMRIVEDFRIGPTPVKSEDNSPLWQITQQFTIELEVL